jgi:Pvc16 N-terminal domain
MATYRAIEAVSQAIIGLLKAAPLPPEFSTLEIKSYRPADFSDDPPSPGISLYLYRVSVNTVRRMLPRPVDQNGNRHRPALPIDLHYLLTPWATMPETQQILLGWSMRVLEDTPLLSSALLNPDVFLPDETVEIVSEPLPLQEIINIWDAFKPNFQISAAYSVRMVPIDSLIVEPEGALVQSRTFTVGKGPVL